MSVNEEEKSRNECDFTNGRWQFRIQSVRQESEHVLPGANEKSLPARITDADQLLPVLEDLFLNQRLAVLCTQREGAPYGNLVAFSSADELTRLVFVTPKATRKFANITADHRVAMLIDNRSNDSLDFSQAIAVTATGRAFDLKSEERERLLDGYLLKHPHLAEFAKSPSCAVISIEVETYYCVYRFQNVMELHLKQC